MTSLESWLVRHAAEFGFYPETAGANKSFFKQENGMG